MTDSVQLPEIPGGWTRQEFVLPQRTLHLTLPANPDLFLDDPQVLQANAESDYMPYWSFLWPSAVPTATALQFAPWPVGSQVLEIGCGLGLVGLAALARGDRVIFSDHDATSLESVQRNAAANRLPVPETLLLDWREPLSERYPVILGCEVTYDANMHSVLLDLLNKMLAPGGVCWLSDPGRYQAPRFYELALKRGYAVRILDKDGQQQSQPSVQSFQIFELRHGGN